MHSHSHHRDSPAPERVSNLELFFDLVFVFTITQVATVVEQSPNAGGLVRAAFELWIIAWMYGGYAWLTNSAGPDTWQRRLLLLVGMAGFFVCALAVPHAFDENAVVFGAGYLLVVLVHLTGFLLRPGRTPIRAILRLAPWNLISASLVLAAGFTGGSMRLILWGAAISVQLATPLLSRTNEGFMLNAEHFAERHGLMILIVLGESLVSVGLSVQHHERVDSSLLFGAMAGLALAAAMWWSYFVGEDERAAHAFGAASPRQRADQALLGYGLAHAAMLYGVVALAAGTKLSVEDLAAPTTVFSAWLMAAGAAVFLAGTAAFRVALRFASPLSRILGAIVCLAAALVGPRSSAAAELALLAVIVAGMLVVERRS
ncbi:MAG: low temperature requirement protein A [bacterium]